eukprot:6196877-Pleurochrysis_carterae.AAC.2
MAHERSHLRAHACAHTYTSDIVRVRTRSFIEDHPRLRKPIEPKVCSATPLMPAAHNLHALA